MPVTPSYPGVYIEEIPSGVRTIAGVSTSVTAFLGTAPRGPVNQAVRILNYGDYERRFGGLAADSELGYAVRQFFQNGGGEAWVVRVIGAATAARLRIASQAGDEVLEVTALDAGLAGNDIEVDVDYETENPSSTFNLTVTYTNPDNPAEVLAERFPALTMNRQGSRYVADVVNGTSRLVKVARLPVDALLAGAVGTSLSGPLDDVTIGDVVDADHNALRVSANGLPPVSVTLPTAWEGSAEDQLDALAAAIQAGVAAGAGSQQAYRQLTCVVQNGRLLLTSGVPGEASSVRVLPGERNDASAGLRLGTAAGGEERDAVAEVQPQTLSEAGMLRSAPITSGEADTALGEEDAAIGLEVDGLGVRQVALAAGVAPGSGLKAKLTELAERIQSAVRAVGPEPAYRGFTAAVEGAAGRYRLVLASGTRGAGSRVRAQAAEANDVAATLHLVGAGSTTIDGASGSLTDGTEVAVSPANRLAAYNGSRGQRTGIYALEGVDLFSLMVLPGVTDPGVVAEAAAYCRERRAFLIVDAPREAATPDEMVALVRGPSLPKTDRAAVYFPWIQVADPLRGGKPRLVPPSGTIAGLIARTDGTRGIWKAPAGTEATLNGVQGVDYVLTDAENGLLNPRGVNAIRLLPGFGPVAWGARTLRGDDQLADEWKYVPVRRLALYIEESLYRGTQWAVFEPNDEPLWAQLRLNIGAFMHNLFRQGAFQGKTPAQAYLVKCDAETTTQADRDLGIVNILVGFAPLKPAEFVIIRLQQKAGELQA